MAIPPASISSLSQALPATSSKATAGRSSDNLFAKLIKDANQQNKLADEQFQNMASGQSDGLHNVVLGAAKADLSFRLVLELRNKLMDSYQEIMRMQV